MIKAFIFDMDGVLIDSEPLWEETETLLLKKRGIAYNASYRDKILGLNQTDSANLLIDTFNLSASVNEIIEERESILLSLYENELKLIPGVIQLLTALKKIQIKIGLASSSGMNIIEYVLDKFRLNKYFESVVSGECISRGKPHPDIYLRAAKLLNEKPENCIAVEDSINGVLSAKKSGMYCIAIPDKRLEISKYDSADVRLENLSEINLKNLLGKYN